MNYEQEFEILAVLCPITPRDQAIAASAIIASREAAIRSEMKKLQTITFTDERIGELAMKGLQSELDRLHDHISQINGRLSVAEEMLTVPRRGRKPGSKNKPKVKPEEVVVDTTQHSEGLCRQCGMGGSRCVCAEAR